MKKPTLSLSPLLFFLRLRSLRGVMLAGFLASGLPSLSLSGPEPAIKDTSISSVTFDLDELDKPVQFVNQEFDPSLLDNLPQPPTVSQRGKLSVILEKDQWRGSQCGITRNAQVVFREPAAWERFWTLALSPYLPSPVKTPAIDFHKEMVVGIFLGEKPFPGDQIEIHSAKVESQGTEQVLMVYYRPIHEMQGVFNPPFPVQPYHLKKTPLFPGVVVFQETKR